MGERYARLIDPNHFLGRSAFDIHPPKEKPPVNIVQNGKLFEMQVMVPGFRKGELEVKVENSILIIRGEKSESRKEEEGAYVLEEFNFDSFERRFRLSDSISREKISARYENGMLYLTFVDVPAEEEREAQTVEVQ